MLDDVPGVQEVGYLLNGSTRQTGNTINQLSDINGGNIRVHAHSQGTDQTYLGIQQHQDEIAEDIRNNPTSVFSLQNSGSPASSEAVQDLVVNGLYGGEAGIKIHLGEDSQGANDVFRSQVNPGDPIGALGGNFGGVNNNAPITSEAFWKQISYTFTRGWTTIANGKEGDNPSPHSGYPCQIGCGENEFTTERINQYYNPSIGKSESIENYYDIIKVDSSKALFGSETVTASTQESVANPSVASQKKQEE